MTDDLPIATQVTTSRTVLDNNVARGVLFAVGTGTLNTRTLAVELRTYPRVSMSAEPQRARGVCSTRSQEHRVHPVAGASAFRPAQSIR